MNIIITQYYENFILDLFWEGLVVDADAGGDGDGFFCFHVEGHIENLLFVLIIDFEDPQNLRLVQVVDTLFHCFGIRSILIDDNTISGQSPPSPTKTNLYLGTSGEGGREGDFEAGAARSSLREGSGKKIRLCFLQYYSVRRVNHDLYFTNNPQHYIIPPSQQSGYGDFPVFLVDIGRADEHPVCVDAIHRDDLFIDKVYLVCGALDYECGY